MAINLYNSAEGGSDGTAVTTLNTGGASGNAFNVITPGTGTITFQFGRANTGYYSYNLTAGSGSACNLTFQFSTNDLVAARAYIYLTAYPTSLCSVLQFFTSTTILESMTTSGNLFLQDATGTISGSIGTNTVPLNTWIRYEFIIQSSTNYLRGMAFVGNDTSSPIYDFSTSSASLGTSNTGSFKIGKLNNAGNWATLYIDDILLKDTLTPLGPGSSTPMSWIRA